MNFENGVFEAWISDLCMRQGLTKKMKLELIKEVMEKFQKDRQVLVKMHNRIIKELNRAKMQEIELRNALRELKGEEPSSSTSQTQSTAGEASKPTEAGPSKGSKSADEEDEEPLDLEVPDVSNWSAVMNLINQQVEEEDSEEEEEEEEESDSDDDDSMDEDHEDLFPLTYTCADGTTFSYDVATQVEDSDVTSQTENSDMTCSQTEDSDSSQMDASQAEDLDSTTNPN